MRRFTKLLSGLLCLGLAGAIACQGREGWPWFLAAGCVFLVWGSGGKS
jgi:hypothetical protein